MTKIKAVIIAAGRGKRLSPFTRMFPKPLVRINGKPLISHILCTLRNAGIEECIIVTGYMEHVLRAYLGDGSKFGVKIHCCYNPSYRRGNATSISAAQRYLKGDDKFLLTMADHLVSEEIITSALQNASHAPLLCVDEYIHDSKRLAEATKVLVDADGYIRDIGKNIPAWNAVDTGVFLLNRRIFPVIDQMSGTCNSLAISQCMKQMIRKGFPLWACNVSGNFWMDIDTFEDVALAEQILRSTH
ncbi:MAG TPA: NDP-sugar synthase [Candidatus Bathyarchaeota archaeon]|nr:NDP-sugar synthase [Candidatus Bathyarchaeota archaeon]